MTKLLFHQRLKPIHVIIVIVAATISLVTFIVLYSQEQMRQETLIINSERLTSIKEIAYTTELRFSDMTNVLKLLGGSPSIAGPSRVFNIDPNLHGVSEDNATRERDLFKQTLNTYTDFESIIHLTTNGDIYVEEPYTSQLNSSVSNYNDTDWFVIMSSTHDVYVKPIVTSEVSGHKITTIGVPIFSDNSTFSGFLIGTLDLNAIQQKLYDTQAYANEQFLIIDNQRNIVASSFNDSNTNLNLDSISSSLYGASGTSVEVIGGTKMYVSFYPLYVAGSSPWAIVLIQPYDDAFLQVNSTFNESVILTMGILSVMSISSYFIIRSFRSQHVLTNELQQSHQILEKSQKELKANNTQIEFYLQEISKIKNALDQSSIVVVTDRDGTITEVNDNFCEITKFSRQELLGENHRILKSGYHTPEFYKKLWNAISAGRIWEGEFKNKAKDGSFYWVRNNIIPHLENGEIIEYVSIGIDITKEKNLQEQIVNSQKLSTIGELSARVAHDIRNPLSVIKNNFDLLQYKDPKLVKKHAEAFDRIKRAILRITYQIENVLDYVRPLTLVLQKENIYEITQSALEKVIIPDGIKVTAFKKSAFLSCDHLKIEVTLINIITNALQAMGQKGALDIICDENDENLILEIRDTGPGIPEDVLPKIFAPLFTTKQIGTGLGLSSCKSIVEHHGGKIEVKSKVGSGTSFIITLPKNPIILNSDGNT